MRRSRQKIKVTHLFPSKEEKKLALGKLKKETASDLTMYQCACGICDCACGACIPENRPRK